LNPYTGEIAALATSLCWTATATLFTFASQKVGSMVLNRIRLLLAVVFLVLTHLLLRIPLPLQAGGERWLWLGLSGIVGLTLGDLFLFQTFIAIGPRLGMLMMSLAPVIAGISAWLFLSEAMGGFQILGVALTLAGVAWVVLERGGGIAERPAQPEDPESSKVYWRGILFGLVRPPGRPWA
jgi:drug/metabolite transporter (DMT)-like permease